MAKLCRESREWERQASRESTLQGMILSPDTPTEAIREQVVVVAQYVNKLLGVDAEAVQVARTAIYA
jgi:hypothetical protein